MCVRETSLHFPLYCKLTCPDRMLFLRCSTIHIHIVPDQQYTGCLVCRKTCEVVTRPGAILVEHNRTPPVSGYSPAQQMKKSGANSHLSQNTHRFTEETQPPLPVGLTLPVLAHSPTDTALSLARRSTNRLSLRLTCK